MKLLCQQKQHAPLVMRAAGGSIICTCSHVFILFSSVRECKDLLLTKTNWSNTPETIRREHSDWMMWINHSSVHSNSLIASSCCSDINGFSSFSNTLLCSVQILLMAVNMERVSCQFSKINIQPKSETTKQKHHDSASVSVASVKWEKVVFFLLSANLMKRPKPTMNESCHQHGQIRGLLVSSYLRLIIYPETETQNNQNTTQKSKEM